VSFLISILAVVLVGLVILVVGAPLRAARRAELDVSELDMPPEMADGASTPLQRDELDAARESKYREIRDAELDYRTGKLSLHDYEAIDAELRSEAIEILNRLEDTDGERAEAVEPSDAAAERSDALEQKDGVQEEQHSEQDRPPV
jgi:hypothetical protein